jgi:hypothetical protein
MKQRHARRVRRDERAIRWRKAFSEAPCWMGSAPSPTLLELDAYIRDLGLRFLRIEFPPVASAYGSGI